MQARPHGGGSHVEGQIGGHGKAEARAARHRSVTSPSTAPTAETKAPERKGESEEDDEVEEILLLKGWNGKIIADKLGLPGLEVEIERAVEQVEKGIAKAKEELKQRQKEMQEETARSGPDTKP